KGKRGRKGQLVEKLFDLYLPIGFPLLAFGGGFLALFRLFRIVSRVRRGSLHQQQSRRQAGHEEQSGVSVGHVEYSLWRSPTKVMECIAAIGSKAKRDAPGRGITESPQFKASVRDWLGLHESPLGAQSNLADA